MWHQLPVILQVSFTLKKGSAVLLSEEPVTILEKLFLYRQNNTGCACNGVSTGWDRRERCAVKQGTASFLSSWWTVSAVFMIPVNWGRVLSHTLLCVGLLWLVVMGTEFLSLPLWIRTRRIKPPSFTSTSPAWNKGDLTPSYKNTYQRYSFYYFPLVVDLWMKLCLTGSGDTCVGRRGLSCWRWQKIIRRCLR